MNKKKPNLYQKVTDTIIEMLSDHLQSWDKPWVILDSEGAVAHNATSKNDYRGINQLLLSLETAKKGYAKNGWLTFNQVRNLGGSVQKGEKASCIYFYKFLFFDKNGKRLNGESLEPLTPQQLNARSITKRPMLRYFNVFNIFQTKGLGEAFYHIDAIDDLANFEKDERAESLIQKTDAKIIYQAGDRAFYSTRHDKITLPLRKQFKGKEAFYETSLHELAHWTGHPSRLDRDLFNFFGSEEYAMEELVAELTAAFLGAELGFTKAITNNAAYIKSWISKLENDNRFIFKAAKQAQKAAEFIKAFSNEEVAAI